MSNILALQRLGCSNYTIFTWITIFNQPKKQCKIVLHKPDPNANEVGSSMSGSLSPRKKNEVDGVASYMVPVSGDSNENDIRCIRDIVERFHSTGGEFSWAPTSFRSLPRVKTRASTADSACMCAHVIAEHLDLVNKFIGHQNFLKELSFNFWYNNFFVHFQIEQNKFMQVHNDRKSAVQKILLHSTSHRPVHLQIHWLLHPSVLHE